MTISVLQERQTSNGSGSASSIVLAFSNAVTVGSSFHSIGQGVDTATSFTCSDSVNGTHGSALDTIDASADTTRVAHFKFDNTAAGTPSVTITPNTSVGFLGIWIREIGGTSGYDGAHAGNQQTSPATTTDAVTSTNATPSTQPGLVSGFSVSTNNSGADAAGTGFTSTTTGWQFGFGADFARSEHLRYTNTTARAATFTCTANNYITVAAFFKETAATATTSWQPLSNFHPGRSPGRGAQRFYQSPKALNPQISLTVALTGQAATFTSGTLTPSSSVGLSGQAAISTGGTLVPSMSVAVTGQAATFAAGTLIPSSTVGLTGQAGTFAAGTLVPSSTIALSGVAITSSAGTLTANTAIALTGGSASFAAGNLLASSALAITGASFTATAGTLTPSIDAPLQGLSASFTAGIVTVPGDITIALTGQQATFATGQLIAQGAAAEVPAGRRTRTIYRVTIDGHLFEFRSYADAVSFLETAQALAEEHIQRQLPAGPLPQPKLPEIKVNTRELRKVANETRKAIKRVYDRELIHAELRMLLELSRRREEDDTLLFLM